MAGRAYVDMEDARKNSPASAGERFAALPAALQDWLLGLGETVATTAAAPGEPLRLDDLHLAQLFADLPVRTQSRLWALVDTLRTMPPTELDEAHQGLTLVVAAPALADLPTLRTLLSSLLELVTTARSFSETDVLVDQAVRALAILASDERGGGVSNA